ncbi:MAG: lipase family protein [Bdellovibrionales bacterium]|nr:lipase family protein [Bdellovibrionales bacterium]
MVGSKAILWFFLSAAQAQGLHGSSPGPEPDSDFPLSSLEPAGSNSPVDSIPEDAPESFREQLEQMKCFAKGLPPFDPKEPNATPANVYWLGILNWLVYFPPEYANPVMKMAGVKSISYIEKTIENATDDKIDWMGQNPISNSVNLAKKVGGKIRKGILHTVSVDTEAYWIEGSDYAVVSFRGTEADGLKRGSPIPIDIKTDLQAGLKDFGPDKSSGKVHKGFYGTASSVWPDIEKHLAAIKDPKYIYFTGHSMGADGAKLAMVKALQIQTSNPKGQPWQVRGGVTMGEARMGNEKFMNYSQGLMDLTREQSEADPENPEPCTSVRCVNRRDVVPLVPLLAMHYRTMKDDLWYYEPSGKFMEGQAAHKRVPKSILSQLFRYKDWYDSHMLQLYLYNISKQMKLPDDKKACLSPRIRAKVEKWEAQAAKKELKRRSKPSKSDPNTAETASSAEASSQ